MTPEQEARIRVERAERERDEARAGERNMAEHARRVADEANEAFAAAEALDEFWAASGYAGNRGHMTPAEQVSSIIRERDSSDDRAQAAETKLATLTEALLDATASLVAAVSLLEHGGNKAAPSDKMFKMMLADYRKSIARARAALSQTQDE